MNSKQLTPQVKRKRKMLLVLPILFLPFITLIFWALGGGSPNKTSAPSSSSGLNMQLPGAHLKDDRKENKLSFYEQAERDSSKLSRWKNEDPLLKNIPLKDSGYSSQSSYPFAYDPAPLQNSRDPNEEKVYRKLAELNEQLNSAPVKENQALVYPRSLRQNSISMPPDVDHLQSALDHFSTSETQRDPELSSLDSLMEKVLDIQHPERIQEKIKEKTSEQKEQPLPVDAEPNSSTLSLLDTLKKDPVFPTAFYSEDQAPGPVSQNAIEAVVDDLQTLVNGGILKLRLLQDITIGSSVIPKNNFVYGVVALQSERLLVHIASIRSGTSIYPVKLEVYDLDGLPGIYMPGTITSDAARGMADNSLQVMELSSLDPSLKAQATAAAVSSLKTLLTKKIKQVKVLVRAGYKVLLVQKG